MRLLVWEIHVMGPRGTNYDDGFGHLHAQSAAEARNKIPVFWFFGVSN
jgi:hypothetical protein